MAHSAKVIYNFGSKDSGLGRRLCDARVTKFESFSKFPDAWKDHEFLIIGSEANDEWLELLHQVYRLFVEDLQVFCWSTGIALPPLAGHQSPLGAIARISSRCVLSTPNGCSARYSLVEIIF